MDIEDHVTKTIDGTQSPVSNRHYIPALDGLRAFAVTLVVLQHLSYRAAPGGSIGVDVFFVLSGFLITSVLLREQEASGHVSLLAFYARRALRLMPALILMVGCELAFGLVFGGPGPNKFGSALAALVYMMDFVRTFSSYSELSAVGHTWSLAVEEHFYVVWPLLLGPLLTLPMRFRAPIILASSSAVILWRTYLVFCGATHDRTYYAFDTRSDQILAGCALALWLAYSPASRALIWTARLWPLALTGILAITFLQDGSGVLARSAGPALVAALSSVVILKLIYHDSILSRIASTSPMVALGKISYGIYLWHWPFLIDTRYYTHSKIAALGAVFVSVIVAALSYSFVEIPFLKVKRHFEHGGEAVRYTSAK